MSTEKKYRKFLRALMWISMLCFFSDAISAQQNWGNTQYSFNLYDVNLAYAGNHGVSSFGLRNRTQWIGLDGAPLTQQLSWHAPAFKNKVGVGANVQMDKIGLRTQQSARLTAAYRIELGKGNLSAGIGIGALRQQFDKESVIAENSQDTQILTIGDPMLIPIVDAAVFYNTTVFYSGIEFGRVDRAGYSKGPGTKARNYFHTRLVAGYKMKIGDDDLIEISTLIKYAEGSSVQFDGTVQYTRSNFISLGMGYRINSDVYFIAGCNITTRFRFGISYDYSVGRNIARNSGGIEAFIGYNLKNNSGKSIRYF